MVTLKSFNRHGKEIGEVSFKSELVIGFVKIAEVEGLVRVSLQGMTDVWVKHKDLLGVLNVKEKK